MAFVNNGPDAVLATTNPSTISRNRRRDMIEQLKAMQGGDLPEDDQTRMQTVLAFFRPLKGKDVSNRPDELPGPRDWTS